MSTQYVYDNEDIIAELDGSAAVKALYIHGPGIDEPLAMFRSGSGGGLFTFHADGLGSISTLTDAFGTPARTYTYDSFGRIVAETGTVSSPYTYTSREFDPETGLYYYRARYYDPTTGRFLQTDPLFSLNLYTYVTNNPTTFSDPLGLQGMPGFHPFPPGAGRVLIPGLPNLTLPSKPTLRDVEGAILSEFDVPGLLMFQASFRKQILNAQEKIPAGFTVSAETEVTITRSPFNIRVNPFLIPPGQPKITMGSVPGQVAEYTFFFAVEGVGPAGLSCPLFPRIQLPLLPEGLPKRLP